MKHVYGRQPGIPDAAYGSCMYAYDAWQTFPWEHGDWPRKTCTAGHWHISEVKSNSPTPVIRPAGSGATPNQADRRVMLVVWSLVYTSDPASLETLRSDERKHAQEHMIAAL